MIRQIDFLRAGTSLLLSGLALTISVFALWESLHPALTAEIEAVDANMSVATLTLIFCADGSGPVDKECKDGSDAQVYAVTILSGSQKPGCVTGGPDCYAKLNSILEIEQNGKVVFKLLPGGKVERAPEFTNDEAAISFWNSLFYHLPAPWNVLPSEKP